MVKHKWAKEIHAWADGDEIQYRDGYVWHDINGSIDWGDHYLEYRIKPQQKCIVQDCENHANEGKFVGELCGPCWDYITNGKGVHSQAYRNAQPKEPQYLYVYKQLNEIMFWDSKTLATGYIGKIRLELEDE